MHPPPRTWTHSPHLVGRPHLLDDVVGPPSPYHRRDAQVRPERRARHHHRTAGGCDAGQCLPTPPPFLRISRAVCLLICFTPSGGLRSGHVWMHARARMHFEPRPRCVADGWPAGVQMGMYAFPPQSEIAARVMSQMLGIPSILPV